ncbi:MAG: periplasmic heavy metal sensor [Candidatus Rokubacteria bacterium]|nr:periplasmic heavy metal sensor [Candidatus Rokubacteria bacterium]
MNGMTEVMTRHRGLVLAAAIALLMVGGGAVAVTATESDRSEQQGAREPMTEMMRGMRMGASAELLGRERPLLSLALRHRADLALSADQVTKLEGLVERFRKDAEARASQIEAAEQELAGLVKADPADMASVEAKVRAIEKQRADLRLARIRTIAEGRAALSPEQRRKLEELVASRPGGSAAERTRGMEEMERFMNSERMPEAMTAMMDMARRMGDGDVMLGMVRMMEMMGSMGGMMGGHGGGTMGAEPHHATPEERK